MPMIGKKFRKNESGMCNRLLMQLAIRNFFDGNFLFVHLNDLDVAIKQNVLHYIGIYNTIHFFFYKDQQNFFEPGMSLTLLEIKAQMFLECP